MLKRLPVDFVPRSAERVLRKLPSVAGLPVEAPKALTRLLKLCCSDVSDELFEVVDALAEVAVEAAVEVVAAEVLEDCSC